MPDKGKNTELSLKELKTDKLTKRQMDIWTNGKIDRKFQSGLLQLKCFKKTFSCKETYLSVVF